MTTTQILTHQSGAVPQVSDMADDSYRFDAEPDRATAYFYNKPVSVLSPAEIRQIVLEILG